MPRRTTKKIGPVQQRLSVWLRQAIDTDMIRQAEALPLRRDMVTLLTFVRDNKVVGTQSAGNMPLKAVRQVTARFVKPPPLDTTIGDRTWRLRSEADIWPLYYLHILAEVGDLLAIAPARRWRLTSQGEKFLDTDPLSQVALLLIIWWHRVNWLVAYSYEGMGDALPPYFNLATLDYLLSLPVDSSIPFEQFADQLIERTGLTWTSPDSAFATMALHSSIIRMIINVLVDFGGVKCEYREKPLGKGTISELYAFEITPFGRAVLEAVAIMSG